MQIGIHLPQVGRKAGPEAIRRAAERAEELGLADVWVSEHIILPKDAPYPPTALFYEPITTLTWAAAFTRRIRLGTSVLVLPWRHPLPLAKELSTLQNLSNGRLILGAGVGWLEAEFAALGVPFAERGRRMDESIALLRAVWTQDPVSFPTRYIPAEVREMRMLPHPVAPIPIWIGGRADAAIARAARNDGWHGSQISPEDAAPIIARLRAARPDPDFTISVRAGWDGQDETAFRAQVAAFGALGVQHLVADPRVHSLDDWLHLAERIAAIQAHLDSSSGRAGHA